MATDILCLVSPVFSRLHFAHMREHTTFVKFYLIKHTNTHTNSHSCCKTRCSWCWFCQRFWHTCAHTLVSHSAPPPTTTFATFPRNSLCAHNLSPKNITTSIFRYRTADEQNISPGAHLVTAFPCNYFLKHVVACRSCSYSIASSGLEVDRLLRSRAVVSAVKSA